MLKQPALADTAVLINEFGEVGRRSRLVFITRDLARSVIEEGIKAFGAAATSMHAAEPVGPTYPAE